MQPLDHFEFSQSSLQDYVDCRRRFQLRYIEHVDWPAVQAEPVRENEQHMRRGERFHRLAQQYLLGIPAEKLARMAAADEDENLQEWWANFIAAIPGQLNGEKHVEMTLSAPLAGFRLLAKYDLVLIQPDGRAVIYDWKTSVRRPKRAKMASRLQTRVYPFLLLQAGAVINHGRTWLPEQIDMNYWFAEPQQAPEQFAYSANQYAEDSSYLLNLVSELHALHPEEFEMTSNSSACRFCIYRSLCERGEKAGLLDQVEEDLDPDFSSPDRLDFNLEQIGEISF